VAACVPVAAAAQGVVDLKIVALLRANSGGSLADTAEWVASVRYVRVAMHRIVGYITIVGSGGWG